MKKQYRRRTTKPETIEIYYGRDSDGNVDLLFGWGDGGNLKGSAIMLLDAIQRPQYRHSFETFPNLKEEPSLLKELEARGFDIETLRISISRKKPPE